jgi:hypothetical protein
MPEILRLQEAMMRYGVWPLSAFTFLISLAAQAQLGPNRAYPIVAAAPKPPVMVIDSKDRSVIVEVTVGADGRTISTKLVTHSDSGIYDERVRGFWKDQRFVPTLDADGRPREAVLRIESSFSSKDLPRNRTPEYQLLTQKGKFNSSIDGRSPADIAARVKRMSCRDFLWEYDFMKKQSPKKAKLEHEELFHVAFALLITERNLPIESRDALIRQWTPLTTQTVDSCRAQPGAMYWKEAFAHTFDSATPVGVLVP